MDEIQRLRSLIDYIRECKGGEDILREAEALAWVRQSDLREEVDELQKELADIRTRLDSQPGCATALRRVAEAHDEACGLLANAGYGGKLKLVDRVHAVLAVRDRLQALRNRIRPASEVAPWVVAEIDRILDGEKE